MANTGQRTASPLSTEVTSAWTVTGRYVTSSRDVGVSGVCIFRPWEIVSAEVLLPLHSRVRCGFSILR